MKSRNTERDQKNRLDVRVARIPDRDKRDASIFYGAQAPPVACAVTCVDQRPFDFLWDTQPQRRGPNRLAVVAVEAAVTRDLEEREDRTTGKRKTAGRAKTMPTIATDKPVEGTSRSRLPHGGPSCDRLAIFLRRRRDTTYDGHVDGPNTSPARPMHVRWDGGLCWPWGLPMRRTPNKVLQDVPALYLYWQTAAGLRRLPSTVPSCCLVFFFSFLFFVFFAVRSTSCRRGCFIFGTRGQRPGSTWAVVASAWRDWFLGRGRSRKKKKEKKMGWRKRMGWGKGGGLRSENRGIRREQTTNQRRAIRPPRTVLARCIGAPAPQPEPSPVPSPAPAPVPASPDPSPEAPESSGMQLLHASGWTKVRWPPRLGTRKQGRTGHVSYRHDAGLQRLLEARGVLAQAAAPVEGGALAVREERAQGLDAGCAGMLAERRAASEMRPSGRAAERYLECGCRAPARRCGRRCRRCRRRGRVSTGPRRRRSGGQRGRGGTSWWR